MNESIEYQFSPRVAVPDFENYLQEENRLSAITRSMRTCLLDIAYGDTLRSRLDLFPADKDNLPPMVFVHGGYWRGRAKDEFSFVANAIDPRLANVIVLGLTFKENCSDLRNSKVADVVKELQDFGCNVHVHDPLAEPEQALHEYGITLKEWGQLPQNADAIVAAVSHAEYTSHPMAKLLAPLKPGGVFIDIKSTYLPEAITATGACLWRL